MIKTITSEQESQIPIYIKKWVDLASQPIDREKSKSLILDIYKDQEKKPLVIFTESFENTLNLIKFVLTECKVKSVEYDSQLYSQLRSQLDSQLYSQLDSQLDSQLYSQLYSQLDSQLDSQLYSQLRSQLDSQLYSQLYSQLDSQLYSQLRSQLRSQLYSQLYSQLDSQLRSQLYSQLSKEKVNYTYAVNYWYYGWAGYYDFGKLIGVEFKPDELQKYFDILLNMPIMVFVGDLIFICEKPQVSWDVRGLMHSEKEAAMSWKDNTGLYYLHGVSFEKELWEKVTSKDIKAEEIFAIENMEQRRVAYECMDKLKMRELPDYKVLDEVEDDGYGKPMKIVSFTLKDYDTPFYYLNCFCPSTDREYFLETRKQKCWEAKMSSFRLSEDTRFTKEW